MFSLRIDGKVYDGFTAATFKDSAENLCNLFTIKCAADEGRLNFPVKRGASAQLLINDTQVCESKVEKVSISAPEDSYTVSIRGRDITKAILKSDLSASFSLKGPITLKRIMELCMKDIGVNFEIVDEVGDIDSFTRKEIIAADVGGNCWDLWRVLAEKKQVIISTNRVGQVVIRRNGDRVYNKKLVRLISDPLRRNNVLASEGSSSDEGRVKEIYVVGSDNVSVKRTTTPPTGNNIFEPDLPSGAEADNGINDEQLDVLNNALKSAPPDSELYRAIKNQIADIFPANVVKQNIKTKGKKSFKTTRTQRLGFATDALAVDGIKWETAETPCNNKECEAIAKRRLNDSRVKSVSYTCTVSELDADDDPWEAGWTVNVTDEYCDVDAAMYIREVFFKTEITEDGDPVETCQMQLTIPDAYNDNGNASSTEKQITVIGEKFNIDNLIV